MTEDWKSHMDTAIKLYLEQYAPPDLGKEHTQDTPQRVIRSFEDYGSGSGVDPAACLNAQFANDGYDEMIHIPGIHIHSLCAHHLREIIGKAHFAYIPGATIVGLSKIPRMIDIISKQPQVQERLTRQIVNVFYDAVNPKGCAVHISAYHFCMLSRGVREMGAFTQTTALRGCFRSGSTKEEFLMSIDRTESLL